MPKINHVTVCMPVYNGGKTISATLDNLLHQTYRDFEVLVYDDGSLDRTAEFVSRVSKADSRVRLVSGDRNRGRGFARNALLGLTTGRMIAWQDADDLWHPEKLEREIGFASDLPEELADCVLISSYEVKKLDLAKPESVLKVPPKDFDLHHVLGKSYRNCHFQLQATLGPSDSFARAGGFDPALNWAEDLDIALKLLQAGVRIVGHPVDVPLFTYQHTIKRAAPQMVADSQDVVRARFRDFCKAHDHDLDKVMDVRAAFYVGRMYASRLQFPKALATNILALKHLGPDDRDEILALSVNIVGIIRSIVQSSASQQT